MSARHVQTRASYFVGTMGWIVSLPLHTHSTSPTAHSLNDDERELCASRVLIIDAFVMRQKKNFSPRFYHRYSSCQMLACRRKLSEACREDGSGVRWPDGVYTYRFITWRHFRCHSTYVSLWDQLRGANCNLLMVSASKETACIH